MRAARLPGGVLFHQSHDAEEEEPSDRSCERVWSTEGDERNKNLRRDQIRCGETSTDLDGRPDSGVSLSAL